MVLTASSTTSSTASWTGERPIEGASPDNKHHARCLQMAALREFGERGDFYSFRTKEKVKNKLMV